MPLRPPGPLVSADWVADRLSDPIAGIVLVDVRWYPDGRSGREAYGAGHLPDAVFLDMDDDLSGPTTFAGGRHPLPDPAAFAASLGAAGIGDDDPVVVYDDAKGSIAARLWWMLRVLDHPAAVLDGGIDAWTGPQSSAPSGRAPATFTAKPWPVDRFATIDQVDELRDEPGALLIDARAADRFAGAPNPLDPRPGHIPGARSGPWADNIDPETGRFRRPLLLRERFESLGADEATDIVASCGSGVTACHDLLALELAGFDHARLFVGSWSAWGGDPDRPVATGADVAPGADAELAS